MSQRSKVFTPMFHPFLAFKRLMPKTLFARSLLMILLPLILVQAVTTYVFIDRHWTWVTQHLGKRLAGQIATTVEAFEHNDDRVKLLSKRFDFRIRQSQEKPQLTTNTHNKLIKRYLWRYLRNELAYPFQIESSDHMIYVHVELPQHWITISTKRKFLFSMTTPIFLIWSLCTPLLFFLIAALFMRNQIRPIRRLADAVHRFGRGEHNIDIKPQGADEIRRAAVAFRVMQQRIQRQIHMRTELLAGVSHDLRTPLTRMELAMAMMPASPHKDEILKDVREMTATIQAYIAFARGDEKEIMAACALKDLLNDCLRNVPADFVTIHSPLKDDFIVHCRYNSLRRGLTNIIENAQRYADHMWMKINVSKQHLYIAIEDNGPGIPADARLDVFKPFYRLEPSRNQQTGGTGLGLTIAREAFVGHGGTITLADSSHGGLAVHIRLPL